MERRKQIDELFSERNTLKLASRREKRKVAGESGGEKGGERRQRGWIDLK